ncbi:MAG: hypothetical protein WCX70_01820 [Candidatus Paceibacterota bacterium]|jgi:hypothetical protein
MENLEEIRLEDIEDKVILLNISQTYRPHMEGDENSIYDIAKQAWSLSKTGESKDLVDYALAIYQNRVKGVFSIDRWKKAEYEPTKWEFEGKIAPDEIRNRYLNKKIVVAWGQGQNNSFRYLNCNPSS